ncbi:MAG: diguanylate cyclase [Eubacteriaceae bacterium]|nr:diguanylate cyclase [Eubacteriaceae bacterium]
MSIKKMTKMLLIISIIILVAATALIYFVSYFGYVQESILIILFLVVVLIIVAIDMYIINKHIFKRLNKLSKHIENNLHGDELMMDISVEGNDEITMFANTINSMWKSLFEAGEELKEAGSRFKIIMESTNDGYFDMDFQKGTLYISPKWKEFIGYGGDAKQLLNDHFEYIHPQDRKMVEKSFEDDRENDIDYFEKEYRLINKDFEVIWVLQRGRVIKKDKNSHPIRIAGTLLNITEIKNHENKILYLSHTDRLTSLHNRRFMEKRFEVLDSQPNSNFSILMGDLNGLKMINDAFGHKFGDDLIKLVGEIILKNCQPDDSVARWSGDEFMILINSKNDFYVETLIEKIKTDCDRQTMNSLKFSIALGWAKKTEENETAEMIMALAEKRMYRHKIIEKRSPRSSVIQSLKSSIHEKHSETEEHTNRLKNLCMKIGMKMNFSPDKMDELELLSMLHDVGKIGIPDSILSKPGKLNEDEWKIMMEHSEIGYRIAASTPELSHIANYILCHHERFDGKGYPQGIQGEEIPLLSRVISLVDSYDVMTHSRAYKNPQNMEIVINEISSCAGNQFDPEIVAVFMEVIREEQLSIKDIADFEEILDPSKVVELSLSKIS